MLVAVAKTKLARGVAAPGENGLTYDWREPPGSPKNTAGVHADYVVMELDEALRCVYNTDAHLVPYIVIDPSGKPLARQPRINKSGLPWLYAQGYQVLMYCAFADFDNPGGHKAWNPSLYEAAAGLFRGNPWIELAGIYYTRAGVRFYWILKTPIPVAFAEAAVRYWLLEGHKHGVLVDLACTDWTRHYRLPNVVRKNKDGTTERVWGAPDVSGLHLHDFYPPTSPSGPPLDLDAHCHPGKIDLDVLREYGDLGARRIVEDAARYGVEIPKAIPSAARKARVSGPVHWIHDLPDEYTDLCEAIGEVVSAAAIRTGHALYMPLSGALLYRGVPPEILPAVIAKIAQVAGHHGDDYGRLARDTAAKYAAGRSVTGFPTFAKDFPDVARTLDAIGFRRGPRRVAEQQAQAAKTAPDTGSLEVVQQQMYDVIRFGQERLTYIESSCGSGKSYVAARVAADRHHEAARTPTGRLQDDPEHTVGKTAITGDKHALAIQTAQAIQGFDVPVKRLFSPASLRDAKGQSVCKFEDTAKELAAGGLSVPKLLCKGSGKEPCPHLDGCAAASGWEGDARASVVVATHAKLNQAAAEAGAKGLIVIDEPPSLLRNEVLTEDDLAHAAKQLGAFADRYADAMRPLLEMVAGWFAAETPGGPQVSALEIAQVASAHVNRAHLHVARIATGYDEENGDVGLDAFAVARHAIPEGEDTAFAPTKLHHAIRARHSPGLARALGRAHKTLHTLYACAMGAFAADFPPKLRVEEARDGKVLRVVCPNHDYVAVLTGPHRVVILGAKADLHVREVQAVAGCPVDVKRFAVADGAPVARTIMPATTANRSMWLPAGAPIWNNGIVASLERALAWAQEDPTATDLCLITFRPIAVAIEATLAPQEPRWTKLWTEELHLPARALQKARTALQPVVSAWRGTWIVGYYGATRGMNHAQHVQALITLGDPRPNVDAEHLTAAYMKLEDEDYVYQKAQEELEQAHGRLRAPRRTEPARALHVGIVVPYGYGWDKAEQRQIIGSHAKPTAMSATEFADLRAKLGLNQEALAENLDIAVRSVRNYEKGSRIPAGIAMVLRRLIADTSSET